MTEENSSVERYSPAWTARFKELNGPSSSVAVGPPGDSTEAVVSGVITQATMKVSMTGTEAALITEFALRGVTNPHATIPMVGMFVHPNDAGELLTSLLDCLYCDTVVAKVIDMLKAHEDSDCPDPAHQQ